jgi:hypothetical protein
MRLQELEDRFMECRAMRHRWDRIPDDGGAGRKYKESRSVRRIKRRCETCGMVRYEAWNKITGDILFVQYVAPKDYSLAGEGVKPWDVRREYLLRMDRIDGKKLKLSK